MRKLKRVKKYQEGDEVLIPKLPGAISQEETPIIPPVVEEPKPKKPDGVLLNPSTIKGSSLVPQKDMAWWDEKYRTDKAYQKEFDLSLGRSLYQDNSADSYKYNNWYYNKYQPNRFGVQLRNTFKHDLHGYMSTREGALINAMNFGINAFSVNGLNKENDDYQNYWKRKYQTPEDIVDPNKYGDWAAKKGGMFLKKYKEGGEVRTTVDTVSREQANAEAEKGEYVFGSGVARNPFAPEDSAIGAGLYHINKGNSHAKGGTPLKVSEGDFFFSKDKSMAIDMQTAKDIVGKELKAWKDRTPAALASHYKKLNEFIRVSQDKDATPLERKTATLNIENMMSKLAEIAVAQEAIKGFPNGVPAFAEGVVGAKVTSMMPQGETPMMKKGGEYMYRVGGEDDGNEPGKVATGMTFNYTPHGLNGGRTTTGQPNDIGNLVAAYGIMNDVNDGTSAFEENLLRRAKTFGFRTDNNSNFSADLWDYVQKNQPGLIDEMQKTFGAYNQRSGKKPLNRENFVTGDPVGARTVWLFNNLKRTPEQTVGRGRRSPEFATPNLTGINTTTPVIPSGSTPPVVNTPNTTTSTPFGKPVRYNYASPVDPLWNEVYGLMAANRQFPDRYPVAQRFYEGENIDALINSGYRDLSYRPYLDNAQRQINTVSSFYGNNPTGTARGLGAFQATLQQNSQDIAQVTQGNLQRRMQQNQLLANNQALKGQYRLQHQKNYVNDLEMLRNNKEIAAKDRAAQTTGIFNTYQQRRSGTQYLNVMSDYFKIDRNSNLMSMPFDIKQAILADRTAGAAQSQANQFRQMLEIYREMYPEDKSGPGALLSRMFGPVVGNS